MDRPDIPVPFADLQEKAPELYEIGQRSHRAAVAAWDRQYAAIQEHPQSSLLEKLLALHWQPQDRFSPQNVSEAEYQEAVDTIRVLLTIIDDPLVTELAHFGQLEAE